MKISEARTILNMADDQWKAFRASMKAYYAKNAIKNKTSAGPDKWNAAVEHAFQQAPLPGFVRLRGKQNEQALVLTAAVNTLMFDIAKKRGGDRMVKGIIIGPKTRSRTKVAEVVDLEDGGENGEDEDDEGEGEGEDEGEGESEEDEGEDEDENEEEEC